MDNERTPLWYWLRQICRAPVQLLTVLKASRRLVRATVAMDAGLHSMHTALPLYVLVFSQTRAAHAPFKSVTCTARQCTDQLAAHLPRPRTRLARPKKPSRQTHAILQPRHVLH